MAAAGGALRSEALLSARAAHFVCFPGTTAADRIITVRACEWEFAGVLLALCRGARPVDRGTLQAACAWARGALRAGMAAVEVLADPRSLPLRSAEKAAAGAADAAADAGRAGTAAACAAPGCAADADTGEAAATPASPPPLAAPATPPCAPDMRCLVGSGRRLMESWAPLEAAHALPGQEDPLRLRTKLEQTDTDPCSEALPPLASPCVAAPVLAGALGDAVPVACLLEPNTLSDPRAAASLRGLARDMRRAGRCIGMVAFALYGYLRRTLVHVILGQRRMDLLRAFAPALAGGCHDRTPPCTVVFCRSMVFWEGDVAHRVLRGLRTDADLVRGNHWVVAVPIPGDRPWAAASRPHYPCQGRRCGRPGGSCMSPLAEQLREAGHLALPTVEQGDCGLDVMAFWDGRPRTPATWRDLRLELVAALDVRAEDVLWQGVLEACGEAHALEASVSHVEASLSHVDDAGAGTSEPRGAIAQAENAVLGEAALCAAVRFFCGWAADEEDPGVRRLVAGLSLAEQVAAVAAHDAALADAAELPAEPGGGGLALRRYRTCPRPLRDVHAACFVAWCQREGVDVRLRPLPYGCVQRYLAGQGLAGGSAVVWLTRRARALARCELTRQGEALPPAGRGRKRRRGGGRPCKVPALRQELMEWFISVRGTTAVRLSTATALAQARLLRERMMREAVRRGSRVPFPRVDSRWLLRWRREYQISLRLPNRRWKVSRGCLLERLEITWLNVFRLRHLCVLCHGYDPDIEGFDQKPMHFNESGSRMRHTLAWRGSRDVPLKEVSSQTRERWTLSTYVSSNPRAWTECPPLEALFKGGPRVLSRLEQALDSVREEGDYGALQWLSVAVGPRGSYRAEHVARFLERHLQRALALAEPRWRVLLCDVFAAHSDAAVLEAAARQKCALAFHGGGCTGVLQCNDTHLHQRLSARYQDLEQADLLEQARLQPGACPRRDREDCLRDAAAAWRDSALHERAVAGHFENMLAVPLDGSGDDRGRGDAARFFAELGMAAKRSAALAEVTARWQSGELTWENHRDVVLPFPRRGELDVYAEGQEDEGTAMVANAWSEREGPSSDEADVEAGDAATRRPLTEEQLVVLGEVSERLRQVDEMLTVAKDLGNPHVILTLERARHTLLRRRAGERQLDPAVAAAARDLRQEQDEALRLARARCTAERAARLAGARPGDAAAGAGRTSGALRLERRALRLRRAGASAHPRARRGFDAADLGQGRRGGGGERYRRNRFDLAARVATAFPALAGDARGDWDRCLRIWDARRCREHGAAWGHMFREEMKAVVAAGRSGDLEAWTRFTGRVRREVPDAEITA